MEENRTDRTNARSYPFFVSDIQAELIRGVEPSFAIPTDARL